MRSLTVAPAQCLPSQSQSLGSEDGLRPTLGTHLYRHEVGSVIHAINSRYFLVQIGIATYVPLELQGLWVGQCEAGGLVYRLSGDLQP